jgi:hypothetical protein
LITGSVLFVHQRTAQPESYRRLPLWRLTENDVLVEVEVRESDSGQLEVLGTFTPTREHFHLYSKDLPESGLNGLGRPTLLRVTASDRIKSIGSLVANQPVRNLYIGALGLSFPVYPEGPVTLSFPFELATSDYAASMELSVAYMACSDKTCLPPVTDKRLLIKISEGSLQQQ